MAVDQQHEYNGQLVPFEAEQTVRRPITSDDIGMKCLFTPDPTAFTEVIDIIAIHGIAAHPDETWCKGGVNWLSDESMLRSAVPNARILRYGYQSTWYGTSQEVISTNTSRVAARFLSALTVLQKEVPYRPIILIAHCFGGLVALKALLSARDDNGSNGLPRWGRIFDSITGIIFLGTPFRGSDMKINEMLNFVRSEQKVVQGEVLRVLQGDDEYLKDLVDRFGMTRRLPNSAKVTCFYEMKQSNVGAIVRDPNEQMKIVVNESSGCLDSTEKYSLNRDHFEMNKFDKFDDEDFSFVCNEVTDMMKRAPGIFLARRRSKKPQDRGFTHPGKLPDGAKYFKEAHPERFFWQYLTSASHGLYEAIYNACVFEGGNGGENIDFFSFLLELERFGVKSEQIIELWTSLPYTKEPPLQPLHSKGYTMAILYMVHMKICEERRPDDLRGGPEREKRLRLLQNYAIWVPCLCKGQCGLEWTFANDESLSVGKGSARCEIRIGGDNGDKAFAATKESWESR
ncbi:hypothetical protein VE01_03137 [Pseudogymnoascus verrucosus]|uniref:Uncharacterized protein n=1 Tax=Pseudogymnoascus verrucosus TaxID=342668 RepID=A0A1B8GR15_9PEZI|nr:uncharacterized protein VE01_03137 [Pseudogymnoascus verrucosus]OBT98272.2 hypothetical protein VE01_03137 [Pseudogymnoascus verrucosus]